MKIKKVIGKKIWSLILAVVMVIGLLPQMTIPVQAAVVADSNFQDFVCTKGSTAKSTKITVTVDSGCTLKAQVSSTGIVTTPNEGDTLPAKAFSYASGSNLGFVDVKTYKYVGIYEVDSGNKIVKFKQITLTDVMINSDSASAPTFQTVNNSYDTVTITAVITGSTFEFPSVIDGKVVTAIGSSVFYLNSQSDLNEIAGATIPASVTSIGDYAFQKCTALQTVSFATDSALKTIGKYAFWQCIALNAITIPAGVTSIGENAFSQSGLTSITIPKGVTSIGYAAFNYCTALQTVSFASDSKLESIGDYAFSDCTALNAITIPAGVTSIGYAAFMSDTSLKSIIIPESMTSIGGGVFSQSGLTSITIPKGVTSIGVSAFQKCTALQTVIFATDSVLKTIGNYAFGGNFMDSSGCTALESIEIPASVTSIGNYAFSQSGLTSITIPKGVTSIGDGAFARSLKLESVRFAEGSARTTIGESVFAYCPVLKEVNFSPDSKLESIGSLTFNGCIGFTSLASITFPAGMKSIGRSAFNGCTGLTSAIIPKGVTLIDDGLFYGCTGLSSVTIPEGVTSIGYYAFQYASLKSVTIPASVYLISEYAFADNRGLTEAYFCGKAPFSMGRFVFINDKTYNIITVYCTPENSSSFSLNWNQSQWNANNWDSYKLNSLWNPSTPGTSYTVTYNANGAAGTAPTQVATAAGGTFSLPANSFTKTDYTFAGWNDGTKTYQIPANYTMPAKAVTFTAQWTENNLPPATKTYTVTYNANGGAGSVSAQTTNVGTVTTIAANTFARTGYTFAGWNTLSNGKGTSYAASASFSSQTAGTTVILYAQWTENTFNVDGSVEDDKKVVVSDAIVKLMKGNIQIGETAKTGLDGKFTIVNVPNGTYNLVVSKDGIIVTTIVVVNNQNNTLASAIALPSGKTNSVVEVKVNTPQIVVGNLEKQFSDDDKVIAADGGSVEIRIVAETKDNTAPNASNISATASSNGKTVGLFIDLSVFKTVVPLSGISSTTNLIELPTLVEVFIPLNDSLQGKSNYVVYRYHSNAVIAITTQANADGEKIELVDNNTTIKLTVKKFSTYAVAYNDTTTGGGTTGGGSTGGGSTGGGTTGGLPAVDDSNNTDIVKPMPPISPIKKPAKNPQTGDSSPLALPMMSTMGLALLALGLYLKNKGKQQSAE
jgi:uncharacterized repeat protein (TIGR02543 family)